MLKNGINYHTEELYLTVPGGEYYNDETNEFFEYKEATIRLKHSLISISKWESKYERPFLDEIHPMSFEESIDYIRFMTITQNVDPSVYSRITNQHLLLVKNYITAKMSGTTIRREEKKGGYKRPISSEVIYYWMTEFNIPSEYQKWHLNRLLMLIEVCSVKKAAQNSNTKSKNKNKPGSNYRSLNRSRRKQHNTRG